MWYSYYKLLFHSLFNFSLFNFNLNYFYHENARLGYVLFSTTYLISFCMLFLMYSIMELEWYRICFRHVWMRSFSNRSLSYGIESHLSRAFTRTSLIPHHDDFLLFRRKYTRILNDKSKPVLCSKTFISIFLTKFLFYLSHIYYYKRQIVNSNRFSFSFTFIINAVRLKYFVPYNCQLYISQKNSSKCHRNKLRAR